MKILVIFLLVGIFLISLTSAVQENLGTYKQGECIDLIQVCASCSYNNITSLLYPNGVNKDFDVSMTKSGSRFVYNLCNTTQIGRFYVNGLGDIDGTDKVWSYYFDISPSGTSGNSNLVFYIMIIVGIYTIAFIGFFGKNEIISIFGGLFMVALGVYLIAEGIIIYRDWITNYFSYITMGIGAYFTFMAVVSLMND